LFSHSENKNASLRYTIKNTNAGSNASAVISALNDVGSSMSIGVGSSNFKVGTIDYANVTALFSKAMGKMVFANFFNQMFLWLYNPSDDNDPANLVELMRLDENGLNVSSNITSDNVFVPQYIFAHHNHSEFVLGADLWTNISFDEEETHIAFGIDQTFNDATNQTFTITNPGIYDISYDMDLIDTSASSTDIHVAGRVIFVNGTGIDGSVFETEITKKDIEEEISHEFLAELIAGNKIIFQFIAGDADVELSDHGTFGDEPSSVGIVIKKIANIP